MSKMKGGDVLRIILSDKYLIETNELQVLLVKYKIADKTTKRYKVGDIIKMKNRYFKDFPSALKGFVNYSLNESPAEGALEIKQELENIWQKIDKHFDDLDKLYKQNLKDGG